MGWRYVISIPEAFLEFRVFICCDLSLPYHPIMLMLCTWLFVYKRTAFLTEKFKTMKRLLTLRHRCSIEVLIEVTKRPVCLWVISHIFPDVTTRSIVVCFETIHVWLIHIMKNSGASWLRKGLGSRCSLMPPKINYNYPS